MFGSASNLETVNGADVQVGSLTPAEKFKLVRNYFSPSIFMASAIGAGIQQAADSRHGYG